MMIHNTNNKETEAGASLGVTGKQPSLISEPQVNEFRPLAALLDSGKGQWPKYVITAQLVS